MDTRSFALASALLLAVTHLAQAQETESTPGISLRAAEPGIQDDPSVTVPTEQSTSNYPKPGTPRNTPTPTPEPASTPRAAASPSATPAASPAASPTRSASPAKSSPTPSPAATTAAAATATPSKPLSKAGIVTAVKQLENRWAAAIASHDASVPQELVAADYIGVSSTGKVVNKATLIADMKADKNTYDSAVNSGMTVRVHGNTAVIVGTTKQAGKTPDGKPFNYTYRWTDTWMDRGGQWQCVASQSLAVSR